MSANAERFRMGVGAVIRRADGRVLALERRDIPGSWQFVQGGVRAGESVNDALFREITEETGLSRSSFGAVHEVPVWLGYELPEAARSKKTGRGQVHKWFFMEFIGRDEAVQLDGGGELVNFQWIAIDALTDIVVPFRRPVYRELVKWSSEFAGLADGTGAAPVCWMPNEISWSHDFDAALASAGNKLVLLDFSAAPM